MRAPLYSTGSQNAEHPDGQVFYQRREPQIFSLVTGCNCTVSMAFSGAMGGRRSFRRRSGVGGPLLGNVTSSLKPVVRRLGSRIRLGRKMKEWVRRDYINLR